MRSRALCIVALGGLFVFGGCLKNVSAAPDGATVSGGEVWFVDTPPASAADLGDDASGVPLAKVDFLFVIDDTTSMCQEQAAIARSAAAFFEAIQTHVDYRVAVISQDMLTETKMGRFECLPAQEYPYACAESQVLACTKDDVGNALCTSAFGAGWTCEAPDKSKQIENCNGSVNSKCVYRCADDTACDAEFAGGQGGSYKCVSPSGSTTTNSACVLRPPTAACPSEGEIQAKATADNGTAFCFLTNATAPALFPCIAVVGGRQEIKATQEQNLAATIAALSKDGPNADQAKAFLRDDATLVIVYVEDEEDCSVAKENPLTKEQYGTCTCLSDSDHGGPLVPVPELINQVKALKTNAGQIIVAAVIGDSLKTADKVAPPIACSDLMDLPDAPQDSVTQDRLDYCKSKCSKCDDPTKQHPLLFNSFICSSPTTKADYAGRIAQFVAAFGNNGILTNLCGEDSISKTLTLVADRLVQAK